MALAEAKLKLIAGDDEAAERWLGERGWGGERPASEVESPAYVAHIHRHEHLLHVRVLMAQNQMGEALASLARLQIEAAKLGRLDLHIEAMILKALAFQ